MRGRRLERLTQSTGNRPPASISPVRQNDCMRFWLSGGLSAEEQNSPRGLWRIGEIRLVFPLGSASSLLPFQRVDRHKHSTCMRSCRLALQLLKGVLGI